MESRSDGIECKVISEVYSDRKIHGKEWMCDSLKSPILVISGDCSLAFCTDIPEQLSKSSKVLAVEVDSYLDVVAASWFLGEPVVLVALGSAGKLACKAASISNGAFKAVVLVDSDMVSDSVNYNGLGTDFLIFRGRQSLSQTHAEAVGLSESFSNSFLIEPENCGSFTSSGFAVLFANCLGWYLSTLGKN